MPAEAVGGPAFGGVSLEQFAGISAALADALPATEVFAQEQVDAERWPAAERAWREAIADSTDLQLAYMQKRRIAEDCLGRAISPLDDDPGAWAGLLGALATADDLAPVLDGLGITAVDVARLGRKWKAKAQRDPDVAKQLTELAPDAKPPLAVKAGPAALRPFPWSPKGLEQAPSAAEEATGSSEVPSADGEGLAPAPRRLASFQLAEATPSEAQVGAAIAPLGAPVEADPDQTAMLPTGYVPVRALPFEGETSPEKREAMVRDAPIVSKALPRYADPANADPDETAMLLPVAFATLSTGTFRDRLGPVAVPLLSFAEYVELRAALAMRGEDDEETLERFGVMSSASNTALKARFAEYFKREPDAQRHFVDAVTRKISELRKKQG